MSLGALAKNTALGILVRGVEGGDDDGPMYIACGGDP